jgi:palmitoyltransferase
MPDESDSPSTPKQGLCIGLAQRVEFEVQRSRERRQSKPQPWLIRKFLVGLVLAILIYVCYVYVGRFCVTMLRKRSTAQGSLFQGGENASRVNHDQQS